MRLFYTFFILFFLIPNARSEGRNVLLFTIDSCRADRFGTYGSKAGVTPNIDQWARTGTVFTRAYSVSAWTAPGLVSILTGLYPPVHGVNNRDHAGSAKMATLHKLFAQAGYRTPNLNFFTFAPYYTQLGLPAIERKYFGKKEGDALVNWLKQNTAQADPPFFVWYHTTIVHQPYRPPAEALPDTRENLEKSPGIKAVLNGAIVPYGSTQFSPEDKPVLDILYNEELKRVDRLFGQALEILESAGRLNQTLVVLTADHGEELLDHGFVGHASTSLRAKLFEELVHIPLILSWPGRVPEGEVIGTLAGQVDILPTILRLVGLDSPDGIDGSDLFALPASRPIYFESIAAGNQTPKDRSDEWIRGVRSGRYKYISPGHLYDLLLDPREQHDISGEFPDVTARLASQLETWLEESTARRSRMFPEPAGPVRHSRTKQCPHIYTPGHQSTLDYEIHTGALLFDWEGDMETTYLVEYDIGVGDHHVAGTYEVQGNHQIMGPLPKELWTMRSKATTRSWDRFPRNFGPT